MKITSIALASAFCSTAAGPALMNTAFAAENDNPLDPSHSKARKLFGKRVAQIAVRWRAN